MVFGVALDSEVVPSSIPEIRHLHVILTILTCNNLEKCTIGQHCNDNEEICRHDLRAGHACKLCRITHTQLLYISI